MVVLIGCITGLARLFVCPSVRLSICPLWASNSQTKWQKNQNGVNVSQYASNHGASFYFRKPNVSSMWMAA